MLAFQRGLLVSTSVKKKVFMGFKVDVGFLANEKCLAVFKLWFYRASYYSFLFHTI